MAEVDYHGPWKGIDVSMPENMIPLEATPDAANWIVRGGELRSRPRRSQLLPGLPDNSAVTGHIGFLDSNNVAHLAVTSNTGLWQLNSAWRQNLNKVWSNVGYYKTGNAVGLPVQFQIFLNSIFYVDGTANMWYWDGIRPNSLTSTPAPISKAIYDTANILTAGAVFIGELDSRIILLNTIEQVQPVAGPTKPKFNTNFTQRIRWSASGLPFTWDPTVDVGAGFNDELDVPDSISGFMTIGRNGFVFRVNGITEMTTISGGVLPFDFNHLWASERGIGNVYPWSVANYGPIGIFIATDDIYELSLGGFKKIGGKARNAIFSDIGQAVFSPLGSIFPAYGAQYPYLTYVLSIPMPGNKNQHWVYFVEDDCWMKWPIKEGFQSGRMRMVPTL